MPSPDSPPPPPPATADTRAAPRAYTPGQLAPKLVFVLAGFLILACGCDYLWEITGRMIDGKIVDARVAEIHVVEPGRPDIIYTYRRDHPPVRDFAISFQHYVEIDAGDHPGLYRLSVDSRSAPAAGCNVNDIVRVAYYPGDPARLAFAIDQIRTWGAAAIFCGIGLFILFVAIPMAWTARKPIALDPEAPLPVQDKTESTSS